MAFSAVLLAGGESRRMGRDKATIVFEGLPLWQRQLHVLRGLQPEEVFVSARETPAWLPAETKLLLDESPSRGPLSGLTKTLNAIRTSHLVVLAVDMPFMTSKQLQALGRHALPECGVVPVVDGRVEPLAAIYPQGAADYCATALGGEDFSLQSIVRSLAQASQIRLVQVAKEERDFYRSVNEPADLQGGAFSKPPLW